MPAIITIQPTQTVIQGITIPDPTEAISATPAPAIEVGIGTPGDSGAVIDIRGEIPAGAINGINATFSTLYPFVAFSEDIFLNGVRQAVNVDYTITGANQITFFQAPGAGEEIITNYTKL